MLVCPMVARGVALVRADLSAMLPVFDLGCASVLLFLTSHVSLILVSLALGRINKLYFVAA